ncbi:MAG: hypothetical protein NT040_06080 [Bacteroidetes bacterium]|nr:hypothetical protein [Bacteroidota bacterium]
MKYSLIFILVLSATLAGRPLMASTKLDFTTVDMLTYRCFQEKKWDSVIVVGKQALRQNIDYYYLRVRMGISYFEKADYFPAATHLKKARQFNSGDAFVADYLYKTYAYSNRHEEARILRAAMPVKEQDTTLLSHGFLQQVHFETGYTISSNRAPDNLATLMDTDSIYGEQDLYGNSMYSSLALKLKITNRLGLSLAFNYLNFAKTKYIQYGRVEDQLQNIADSSWGKFYHYTFPRVVYDTSFTYHVTQYEGHIGATAVLPWGLKVMPAFHFIHVSYPVISSSYQLQRVTDTGYFTAADGKYTTFPFDRIIYSYSSNDTSFNNFVAALRLTKDAGIFSIGVHGSWSNLNGKKQKQVGASLTCYPLGNLDFYGTTTFTGFMQGKVKRLLLSQVLGAKITPWMWGEANFYYGDYTNANIFNGSIVYNNSDIIDYRAGGTLVFLIGKHMQLSLIYQYFRKESTQIYYENTVDPDTHETTQSQQTRNNPYNTNTLIGGITWKF